MSEIHAETYDAIEAIIEEQGYPPSIRQIGERVGLSSTDSVRERLLWMKREGWIEIDPGKPRAIRLMGRNP